MKEFKKFYNDQELDSSAPEIETHNVPKEVETSEADDKMVQPDPVEQGMQTGQHDSVEQELQTGQPDPVEQDLQTSQHDSVEQGVQTGQPDPVEQDLQTGQPDSIDSDFHQKKANRKQKNARKKSAKGISWPVLIIVVILAMVITSGLTILGLRFYGVRLIGANDAHSSAVKYSLEKATGSKLTIPQIIEKNQDAVVEINTEALATDSFISNLVKEGAGSGVIIDSSGYILTCNHVIKDAQTITVTLKDGNQYPATLVGFDDKLDLAVLKISGENFSTVTYGDSSQLRQGTMVVAMGNPLGKLGGSASAGIISALDREINLGGIKMHLMQTDAAINQGNSGGGLFDDEGRLIGIVVAKTGGTYVEGLGFAIPINTAAKVAKDLIEHGKVTDRAIIGIKILNVPTEEAARNQGLKLPGVYVAEVSSKEAQEAGFEKGDLIAYVDGEETPTSAELFQVLSNYKIGDKVEVVVLRKGKTKTLTTKLTSN